MLRFLREFILERKVKRLTDEWVEGKRSMPVLEMRKLYGQEVGRCPEEWQRVRRRFGKDAVDHNPEIQKILKKLKYW